jgi:hypothetical protein
MKNEDYAARRRPGDNIAILSRAGEVFFCKNLNGVCAFATKNRAAEQYRFYATEGGLLFCAVQIFVASKESVSVDTRAGGFCFLTKSKDDTLRLPTHAELREVFAFVGWQREYHFYAQIDSYFA